MTTFVFSRFMHCDLSELVERLENEYYDQIDQLSQNAANQSKTIEEEESHASTVLYASHCRSLLKDVEELMRLRKSFLIPYINDLKVKKDEGHDCRNCSGKCHVEHNAYLANIKLSNRDISGVLLKLHNEFPPVREGLDYSDGYRVFRNEMAVLDGLLNELFHIEESTLIPKVLEAQRSIHA